MKDTKEVLKYLLLFIGIIAVLFWIGIGIKGCNQAVVSTHIDDATQIYETFQEEYNTCLKLNEDLGNIKQVPDSEQMFHQFSKAQRLTQIRNQINRWMEDYNGKSKMLGRANWKSSRLPYELTSNQFSNY